MVVSTSLSRGADAANRVNSTKASVFLPLVKIEQMGVVDDQLFAIMIGLSMSCRGPRNDRSKTYHWGSALFFNVLARDCQVRTGLSYI